MARIADLQPEGRGNKAVSINTYLRCLKAFMAWAHVEQIVKEPFKLTWLKEEQKILSTFTPEHIRNLDVGGVRCSFHTLRHTFAVNYLQRAGNLEFLRRILGHSSILTTQKYLRIVRD